MPLPGGVTRETAPGRFREFDVQVQACLRNVFPGINPISVEDWASSTGITAAEWFLTLRKEFPAIIFTASDRLLYLIEVRRFGAIGTYVVQPDGAPIQYIRPPFVVSLARFQKPFWAVNRHIQQRALSEWQLVLRPQFRPPSHWDSVGDWIIRTPFAMRKLSLIHPTAAELCSEQFRIRQHSVFESLLQPVDVIRTMNMFNRSYFDERQLQAGAAAVQASLRPGGVWIVGRTLAECPATHDATIFRKGVHSWQVLRRIGHGSEIEPLLTPTPSE